MSLQTSDNTVLSIRNRQSVAGAFYVWLENAAYAVTEFDGTVVNLHTSDKFNAALLPDSRRITPPFGVSIFVFYLAPGEGVDITFDYEATQFAFTKARVWFVSFGSTDFPISASNPSAPQIDALPRRRTYAYIGINGSLENPKTEYYIGAEEGISAGIGLSVGSAASGSVARPGDPRLFYSVEIDRASGYPVVLGDRNINNLGENTDQTRLNNILAECPANLASTACGLHRCRVFYAQKYASGASYSSWLAESGAVALSWPYDDWECLDESCGYLEDRLGAPQQLTNFGKGTYESVGGKTDPGVDGCEVPRPFYQESSGYTFWDPKLYSCGFVTSLVRPPESWTKIVLSGAPPSQIRTLGPETGSLVWWKPYVSGSPDSIGVGCMERLVGTERVRKETTTTRNDVIAVDFYNLDWLTNRPTIVSDTATMVQGDIDNREFVTIDGIRKGQGIQEPSSTIDTGARVSQYLAFGVLIVLVISAILLVAYFYGFGETRVIAPHAMSNAAAIQIANGPRARVVPT